MRARIDISEVEARTKIRAKYLRAIENEEWDLLPGPIYVKSFLKTYGDFLGLDSRMLIDDFKRRYERPSDGELRPIATLSRERERAARGPLLPPWAIVAAVLVAVVVVLYIVGINNGPKTGTPRTAARPHGARAGTHRHRHAPRAHHTAPVARSVRLQLVPTGTVYVCLTDAAGHKLIPGVTYSAGQTIPVHHGSRLLLTLGNAGVDMKVNGKPVAVHASPTAIGLELTPTGTRALTAARQPTCT